MPLKQVVLITRRINMSKTQIAIVAVYVVLGLLNLGLLFVGPFTSFKVINLLIGGYMLFRAKQESEKQ